jgi:hypothetical protein
MASEDRFPRFVGGISALGRERLCELAARLERTVAPSDGPAQIAVTLLAALGRPEDLQHLGVTDAEVEAIGVALGRGTRAAWRPRISAEAFERLPFYGKPSYDMEVWEELGGTVKNG